MDGGQGKRVFVKKDMFNGPNIIEKKKGSVGCGIWKSLVFWAKAVLEERQGQK